MINVEVDNNVLLCHSLFYDTQHFMNEAQSVSLPVRSPSCST